MNAKSLARRQSLEELIALEIESADPRPSLDFTDLDMTQPTEFELMQEQAEQGKIDAAVSARNNRLRRQVRFS